MTVFPQANGQHEAMRNSAELITAHLIHMRAEGLSDATIGTATVVLRKANRELTHGLACSTDEEIAGWLANERWTVKTKATYHLHLTRFLRWATVGGYIDFDPSVGIRAPRPPRRLPRPATPDQVRICLNRSPMPWRLVFWLAAYGGLRAGEIARLTREDVTAEAIIVRGKGDRTRMVPTYFRIWELVEPLPAGPIITAPNGEAATAKWLSHTACRYLQLRLRLPIKLHQLRHRFATEQLNAPVPVNLRTIQELLGHASPATTALYTFVSDKLKAAAVAALPDVTG